MKKRFVNTNHLMIIGGAHLKLLEHQNIVEVKERGWKDS